MRYFIEISYNGKNYHGWQIQPNATSIQEVLERAISTLLRADIKVSGAGRTDTGVHAKQLFAHFDHDPLESTSEFEFRLNSFLPKDISVLSIRQVKDDVHARFHATKREYEYLISLQKDPFYEDFAHQLYITPNISLMNEGANLLLGHQDFQCFSRSKTDVKTYYCTIEKAHWIEKDSLLVFTIAADRFLRNMVRAIVGTLLDVGYEKTSLEQLQQIIKSKDRNMAGASAPAHGLYLTKVEYPNEIFIN